MTQQVTLKPQEVAAIVAGDKDLTASVLAAYLKANPTELVIEGFEVDKVTTGKDELSVGINAEAVIEFSQSGKSDLKVSTTNENVATAFIRDGKVFVHGVAAGEVVMTLSKGEAKAEQKVKVV